ncbi:hypothetical protein [Flavobacterium facile]|jgi:hypothetical protein|uniref:hypothetical protein n=1 Tax=Flavobacterium facile TaxID=2893174 RepID=UPI002E794879|nr:hypothetical protein [Flavobacterium sp. T-12]
MKRVLYIAIIAGFVTSCTNDSAEEFLPQNKKIETSDFSSMEKDFDSLDTGGQGGTTPIKPPKP